jgi:hypothetical protein
LFDVRPNVCAAETNEGHRQVRLRARANETPRHARTDGDDWWSRPPRAARAGFPKCWTEQRHRSGRLPTTVAVIRTWRRQINLQHCHREGGSRPGHWRRPMERGHNGSPAPNKWNTAPSAGSLNDAVHTALKLAGATKPSWHVGETQGTCTSRPCSVCPPPPRHGASSGCGRSRRPADMEGSWQGVVLQLGGLGWGLITPCRINYNLLRNVLEPRTWTDSLAKRPKQMRWWTLWFWRHDVSLVIYFQSVHPHTLQDFLQHDNGRLQGRFTAAFIPLPRSHLKHHVTGHDFLMTTKSRLRWRWPINKTHSDGRVKPHERWRTADMVRVSSNCKLAEWS